MARERFETEIDGVGFRMVHLAARDSIRFESLALQTIGPMLGDVVGKKESEVDIASIMGHLAGADIGKVLALIDMLAPVCEVVVRQEDGRENVRFLQAHAFNEVFTGRGALKWKWLWWCIQGQLGDFFGGSPSA